MYDEQLAQFEAEILRLGALRNNQVLETDPWWHYQNLITDKTTLMLALERAVPELEGLDDEIAAATRRMHRAQRDADHYMDLLWRVVKWSGIPGLLGVMLSAAWAPTPWLPVTSSVLLVGAVLAIVQAIRVRQTRYSPVDQAQAELANAHTRRNAVLHRVHHGDSARRHPVSSSGGGWSAALNTDSDTEDNAA